MELRFKIKHWTLPADSWNLKWFYRFEKKQLTFKTKAANFFGLAASLYIFRGNQI